MFVAHSDYSKWFYGGYRVPAVQKFLYYPSIVLLNLNPFAVPCMWLGIVAARRAADARVRLLPLAVGATTLLWFSVFNLVSVPATAAAGRFSLFFVTLLTLYAGNGLAIVYAEWTGRRRQLVLWGIAIFAVVRTAVFPTSLDPSAVAIGREIQRTMRATDPAATYMVELVFWHYIGVELGAERFDAIRFDRPFDARKRDFLSRFETEPAASVLRSANAQVVALRSEELKNRVRTQLPVLAEHGVWTLFGRPTAATTPW
jgi:hypothetical protein